VWEFPREAACLRKALEEHRWTRKVLQIRNSRMPAIVAKAVSGG
jgi:hypothetical protein